MSTSAFSHLIVAAFLAVAGTAHAKTVRERVEEPEFRLYTVIFGFVVDADSRLQSFSVAKVVEVKSGTTDAVDVEVPKAYIDAARKKVEAKQHQPKLKDGKPALQFTYFFYSPDSPKIVITDLDRPIDKQP